MGDEVTREELVQKGVVLETRLNRMTIHADLAVMKGDPIMEYRRAEIPWE
ncbi:MAG: hypothetical protein R3351_03465 [Nitrospirales bacterium]|nr:hypothetical protein [Nitrospirales bacterium]